MWTTNRRQTHHNLIPPACLVLLIALALIPACRNSDARSRSFVSDGARAYVDKITDGDTLVVRVADQKVKVRVLGIDCPESHRNPKCEQAGRSGRPGCAEQIPRGLKAAQRAAELMKHQTVTLEGPISRDRNGRTLAYIRLPDGRDYGLLTIREGLCEDYGWKYPHPRMGTYSGKGL